MTQATARAAAAPGTPEEAFAFLRQAGSQLERRPTIDLALQVLRVLTERCLGQPALELLEHEVFANTDQRATLRAAVAQLPRGTVDWHLRVETFAANMAVLRDRDPELAARVAATDLVGDRFELLCDRNGGWWLTRPAGRLRQWHALLRGDHEGSSLPPRGRLGPVALLGARHAPVVERVRAATAEIFLTCSHPLYWLEPNLRTFVAWLHTGDLREVLADPRMHLIVGGDAAGQLQGLLASRPGLPHPETSINLGTDDAFVGQVHGAVKVAEQSRQQRLTGLVAKLQERYATRDRAWWAQRYERPRRVLGVTSRFTTMLQHSVRDALAAFAALGWETDVYLEQVDHERFAAIDLTEKLLDFDPDLVLQLDHLRYEWPLWPANLPLLCWIQDPMQNLLCPEAGASIGPYDFVCGYFKKRCVEEFGYPAASFRSTVVPVSERLFHDGPTSPDDRAEYACDVAFVSNASDTIEQVHATFLAGNPPELHPLLTTLFERIRELLRDGVYLSPHDDAAAFVREVVDEYYPDLEPVAVERLKNEYAYRIYDRGRRHETLEWVADWARRSGRTLRLYGRGWEQHPTLGAFAAGVLPHGEPLRAALHEARLSLQLIPAGFRHQRTYETLAAGTLPLTRYCATDFDGLAIEEFVRRREAGATFETPHATAFPGLERITFRTADEFAALADRYLADPAARAGVCDDLRAVVLRRHTYRAVVGDLVEHVRVGLGARPGGS